MKATHRLLLSLIATHETAFATAAARPGYQHDDPSQLTLSHPWPALTGDDYESESEPRDGIAFDDRGLSFDPLEALQDGLEVMQNSWFALWVGTWPMAIDWTAAVLDTHLVSSLSTLSKALDSPADAEQHRDVENDLNRFFGQNVRRHSHLVLSLSAHNDSSEVSSTDDSSSALIDTTPLLVLVYQNTLIDQVGGLLFRRRCFLPA